MNINTALKITIPEGEVYQIHQGSTLLWQKPKIFGVSWNGSNTASLTRTDDAASFSSPVAGKGTTKGSSPFDSYYPWSEIAMETINGNAMVKIPKFWYKWTTSGSSLSLQIADRPIDGFHTSPMHADREDGIGERDYAYIAKYRCNSSYKSTAGNAPLWDMTIGTARSKIAALGTGYHQYDFAAFWTIRMLFLVEWATWDGQSVLANTTNFASGGIVTGGTSSMTYHTGISANGYSFQYRWIEDLWENSLDWVDGIYFSGLNIYCINNPAKFAIGSNGTLIGQRITTTTSGGFIKSWSVPTVEGFEYALFPASINSSEGYIPDGYYYGSSGTCLYTGGSRSSLAVHGPFMMYTDYTTTNTSSKICCRICYLPS